MTVTFYANSSGYAVPELLFLEFVRPGHDRPWFLLTSDGYLYDMGLDDEDMRSDLPLDLQVSIRGLFEHQVYILDWWAFPDERPAADSALLPAP